MKEALRILLMILMPALPWATAHVTGSTPSDLLDKSAAPIVASPAEGAPPASAPAQSVSEALDLEPDPEKARLAVDDIDEAGPAPSRPTEVGENAAGGDGTDQPRRMAELAATAPPAPLLAPPPPPVASARLTVLSLEERLMDGAIPALMAIFSAPLDPQTDFDHFIRVADGAGAEAAGSWVLAPNRRALYFPHITPETRHQVEIAPGLTAANGARLLAPFSGEVTTRAAPAGVSFASNGSVLPAGLSQGLPLIVNNVPEVDIEFLRVAPERVFDLFRQFDLPTGRVWPYRLTKLHEITESVRLARFETHARPNVRETVHIPIADIPELRQPGLYLALMSRPNHFDDLQATHFFVSDIGLHLREHADGVTVIAASLATGEPLENVALQLIDWRNRARRLVGEALTDADGLASMGRSEGEHGLLLARLGDQISLVRLHGPALDLSPFPVDGAPAHAREIFLFAARDLYRPGERLELNLLLRDQDGRAVDPQPVDLRVIRPDGRRLGRWTLDPGALGEMRHGVEIPAGAALGRWQVEARLDPGQSAPLQSWPFHVEEFLPERMRLELTPAEGPLLAGTPLTVAASGQHLHGAPAAGNRMTLAARHGPQPTPEGPWEDGFHFGLEQQAEPDRHRVELPPAHLDGDGAATLQADPLPEAIDTPMAVRLTVSLEESGGRPVTRSVERVVWPGDSLVGIKPAFDNDAVPDGGNAVFDVIRIRPDGAPPEAAPLPWTLINENRSHYWTYDSGQGWRHHETSAPYPVESGVALLDDQGRAQVRFPVSAGEHRLEMTDPASGVVTRYAFRAGWGGDGDAGQAALPDRVRLALDRASYRGGQTARVRVTPPFAGPGWLLVESDRILWRQRINVPAEGMTVEIPVDPDWSRHDLHLSALVFRPGQAAAPRTPKRALGIIHLPLDREERRLAVRLEAPDKTLPRGAVTVRVTVPALAGEPGRVVLAAVDQGVLNITGMPTPDPFGFFFAKRRFDGDLRDLYGRVIERMEGGRATLRWGGGAGGGVDRSAAPPATVNIVALTPEPVVLDENGAAEITLIPPDFNGAARIMAIAFGAEGFGSAERDMVIADPVVVQGAAPRFLAPGDRSRFTLELFNAESEAREVRLRLSAEDPLVLQPVEESMTLAPGARRTLRFPLGAQRGAFGVGTILASIRVGDLQWEKQWRLGVRPAFPGVNRSARLRLAPRERVRLDPALFDGLIAASADGSLRVSPRPPIDLASALKGLIAYPYGCLEQTSSRLYPLLYLDAEQIQRWGLDELGDAARKRRIAEGLRRLAGMQLSNGAFGLWGADSPEEVWLTPFVTGLLQEARDQGYPIPEGVLQRALDHLKQRFGQLDRIPLFRSGAGDPDHLRFAASALTGFVLAREQAAPLARLRTLFEARNKARSGLPLIHLGIALMSMGDQRLGHQAIEEGVARVREPQFYGDDYGTPARDDAWALGLLLSFGAEPDLWEPLLLRLDADLADRQHLSTQERYALFSAGRLLPETGGGAWSVDIDWAGQVEELRELIGPRAWTVSPAMAGSGWEIVSRHDRGLFVSVEATGYPRRAPAVRDTDILVERRFFTPDGAPVDLKGVEAGSTLLVRLDVTSRRRIPNALVVDLLPAGLEAENLNLSQGETLAGLGGSEMDPAGDMARAGLRHIEFRDDRVAAAVELQRGRTARIYYLARAVTPGRYTVPPPTAEDMYRPDYYGVGAGGGTLAIQEPGARW